MVTQVLFHSLEPQVVCNHVRYMRVCVCMYGSCVYVYAFTLHACMCMHVRYMRVRVCIYITCVYVYAFTLQVPAYTCMHLYYMRVRVCIYIAIVLMH